MSVVANILTAVQTALAAINGAGSYSISLAAAGRRRIGIPGASAPTPPCAWVSLASTRSTYEADLSTYRREAMIIIEVRVAATGTTDARALAAAAALDDVFSALEADRSLGGLVLDTILEGATYDGEETGLKGMAGVIVQVAAWWHSE